MRKSTLLWLFLAAVFGAMLFHTSQQVTDGRQKLAGLTRELNKEEETLRVLQAEWSYLNQPDRLEKLARQYLPLKPMKGRQFASLDSIPLAAERSSQTDATEPEAAPAETPSTEKIAAKKQEPARSTPTAKSTTIAPVAKPAPAAKIAKPAAPAKPAPVTPRKAAPVETANTPSSASRDFGDVMKSLGVAR